MNSLAFPSVCRLPPTFTKIMKPVIHWLRSKGLISSIYLDDILCLGQTYESCLDDINQTIDLLEKLGFVINFEKSSIIPARRCKYLGFVINTSEFTLELTKEKREKLYKIITSFIGKQKCKIRDFAQLIGMLIAACPAIALWPTIL